MLSHYNRTPQFFQSKKKNRSNYTIRNCLIPYYPSIAAFYTAEEVKKLLESVKGTSLETVVYLASWFGLRRGEIVGLRWSSIDLERGVLSITEKL